ncbi:MAG: hypothetical protein CVT88_08705 [Candidatus Altiarchaeales archaeon HGW-Altiarchaeales-1]|nr:MAG: hypothetical protein CVT88_08705 [Candidatus Altiarchaeales archaeon HGW-Altiarchaeales-1]
MAELLIKIPEDLEAEIEELPGVDWQRVALDAIRSRAFELELKRSARMRRILVEAISSKDVLSEEEADRFAIELGNKIKEDRLEELKAMGLV